MFLTADICVHSPGHISIHEGPLRFELKKGVINILKKYSDNRHVSQWLDEVRASIFRELGWSDEISQKPLETDELTDILKRNLWEDHARFTYPLLNFRGPFGWLLSTIVAKGHGGTLVIVGSASAADCISFTQRCAAPLSATWRKYLAQQKARWELSKYRQDVVDLVPSILERSLEPLQATELLAVLDGVAGASNLDGAVVLNRDLSVCGAGGIMPTDLALDQTTVSNLTTNCRVTARELLKGKGTRHLSALTICARIPNSLAFVVSQDACLRLFFERC